MGVPIDTVLIFFVCQILGLGPVSGLPFTSISSIPSLKTVEPLPSDESSSGSSNFDNAENLISSPLIPGTLSSKSCQLFVGSPDVNINIFSSKSPSFHIDFNSEQISTADIPKTKLFTSFNLQSDIVSPNIDPASSGSLIDVNPHESTSTSGLSVIPTLNVNFNSDSFKRELRDTVSNLEPCLTKANPNFASSLSPGYTPNYVINSPFSSFPIMPSPKPIFPCLKTPVNLTQTSEDQYSDISSNVVSTDRSSFVPSQCSSLITNVDPAAPLQNNLVGNPVFQPCLVPNKLNLPQSTLSSDCTESCEIVNNSPSGSLFESLSSFADVKKYIDSRKMSLGNIQKKPSIETNICPCQVNQVNNNLMYARALQNKIITEQPASQTFANKPIYKNNVQNSQNNEYSCENKNCDFAAEYENILNIRTNLIPKLQLDNAVVKNIALNTVQNNNDYSLGYPQIQTVAVEENIPVNQENKILLNPTNNCLYKNNNNAGNAGPTISFNNEATQNDNDQGCPQIMSIPIYNRDSFQNTQIIRFSNYDCSPNQNRNLNIAQTLLDNKVKFVDNNAVSLNQNNEGCPELLDIAQNKLNARNNCDTNTNVNVVIQDQNSNCLGETLQNLQPENNCNVIQTFVPNDNLVQALKLMNEAKVNKPVKCPAASINILPFGQTLIDGTPMPNKLVAFESISSPMESTCTDSSKSNNFFTIQDVSRPLPFVPVNPFSYCASSEVPVNRFVTNIVPPVINLPPSAVAPTIASIRPTEAPVRQLFVKNQDVFCNNVQPILTLIDSNVNNFPANPVVSPFVSPNFIPIQSLPQVSFVNSMPSSTVSVVPTVTSPTNFISSVSNLPPSYNSFQPLFPSSYINPLLTTNLPQTNRLSGASAVFPCLNNIVSALTQNIISTLKTKIPSAGIPFALPPVNPFALTEPPSVTSPFCIDTTSNVPRSIPDIPVACNEYLPPLTFIPVTSFNSDLFSIESDETDSCSPFALSKTDAYYPELSFVVPSVTSSDCSTLSGPLFMPVSSLPQSSSVLKINNTGREAKCYEQFVKSVIL